MVGAVLFQNSEQICFLTCKIELSLDHIAVRVRTEKQNEQERTEALTQRAPFERSQKSGLSHPMIFLIANLLAAYRCNPSLSAFSSDFRGPFSVDF